jgi:hypothetical protein
MIAVQRASRALSVRATALFGEHARCQARQRRRRRRSEPDQKGEQTRESSGDEAERLEMVGALADAGRVSHFEHETRFDTESAERTE